MPSSSSCSARPRGAAVPSARTGLTQVTAAAVLWGTTGVVVQLLREVTALSAVSIGFLRLAVAAAVLLALAASRLRSLWGHLRSSPGALALVGAGLGAYQVLYVVAVTSAGVAVATVVSLGLAPVLVAAWESLRGRRLPGGGTVAVLVTATAGLVLVTLSTAQPTLAAPRPLLGLLAAVGSGLGYAATTVLSRHAAQRVPPRELTTVSTAVGALVLAPAALLSGVAVPLELAPVVMLLHLGVVATAVAYGLFYAGLRTTAGSAAAVLTLLEPLTAALLAVAVLREPLPAPALVGGALLLGAVGALHLGGGAPLRGRSGAATGRQRRGARWTRLHERVPRRRAGGR